MKTGRLLILTIFVAIIGLVVTWQSDKLYSQRLKTERQEKLELIRELLSQELALARWHLEQRVAPEKVLTSLDTFQLTGFGHRTGPNVVIKMGHIPLANRLPKLKGDFQWRCLPECQLFATTTKSNIEFIAVLDLEQRLVELSELHGIQLSVDNGTIDSGSKLRSGHSLLSGQSLYLTTDNPMSLTHLTGDLGVTSLWLALIFLLTLMRARARHAHFSYDIFLKSLVAAIDSILLGKFSKTHELLGEAKRVSSVHERGLLQKVAMLVLQGESSKVRLKEVQGEKQWLESHDELTGLYNRQAFKKRLDSILQAGSKVAFLLIDIDEFKEINDASGQQVGNEMLLKLSQLLRRQKTLSMLLGRISGDEFAVALNVKELTEGEDLALSILEASQHVMLAGHSTLHRLSLSIGVVMAPQHGDSFDALMTRADAVLAHSKEQGKGRFASLNDPELEGRLLKQRFMYSRVHSAIRDKRLALACQPIVDMNTGIVSHSEILLRVLDETGEYISAYPLIQAAERHRDVGSLDKWVLNQVLNHLMQCRREGRNQRLAVNISAVSMSDPKTIESILQRIEFSGCGQSLIIEITESAALENMECIHGDIQRLQDLGCRVALDDFGIGYSSVNNLLNLPFDYVKVDGCFIRTMQEDPAISPLLEFLVSISELRGFQLIAEYVENQQSAIRLQQLGVQYAQGYYYGKPELILRGHASVPSLYPAEQPPVTVVPSIGR